MIQWNSVQGQRLSIEELQRKLKEMKKYHAEEIKKVEESHKVAAKMRDERFERWIVQKENAFSEESSDHCYGQALPV